MNKFLASLAFTFLCAVPLAAQIAQPTQESPAGDAPPIASRGEFVLVPPMLFTSPEPRDNRAAEEDETARRGGDIVSATERLGEARFEFDVSPTLWQDPQPSTAKRSADAAASGDEASAGGSPNDVIHSEQGFRWRAATRQSLMFLAIQHGYAMTQPKTRRALKGAFFRDYARSVKSLHGWADGGRFFTNYIAHPMQGSFTGFIQIQNDPKGMKQKFGASGDYWRSRLKAMAWTAAWSTQFEIGPISQASIGNVGEKGKQTYIDIVVTPTIGTAMLITEDALDRFVIERIERRFDNFYVRTSARVLLNPTRTIANLFRFKNPWYRDRPRAR